MDKPTDERGGKPSASKWFRYELCAASYQLEAQARELGQPAWERDDMAASGTKIHSFLESEPVELTESEQFTANRLRDMGNSEIKRIFEEGDELKTFKEKRYWLKIGDRPVLSGRVDRLTLGRGGKLALVQDFKSGWRPPEPAQDNAQLRILAVLVAVAFDNVEDVVVQILSNSHGVLEARFSLGQLHSEYGKILKTLRAISDPNAEAVASPAACRYCAAIAVCPAAKAKFTAIRFQAEELPSDPDQAGAVLDDCELAIRRAEAIHDIYEARMMADANLAITNWEVREATGRREILSALAARNKLEQFGVATALLDKLASYSVTELESAVAKAAGITGKAARDKLAEVLGATMRVKPGKLGLRRKEKL